MSIGISVPVNYGDAELHELATRRTDELARKWRINTRKITDEQRARIPEVVLAQATNKLKESGISYHPGKNAAYVILHWDTESISASSLEELNALVNHHGVTLEDDGAHLSNGDAEWSEDALITQVSERIQEALETAAFYAVGALSVLSHSDNIRV